MAWHILICATILTVNIYGRGFISGSEANSVENKDLIQLFKRDVSEGAVQSSIYATLDKLLRSYANPAVIEEWKTFGMPIHYILQKIASYYNKNKHGSLSEMLEGLLCQLRELQYFGGKSTKTLDDIIKNIDVKPTCSKKQQQELLEMIVKRLSISHMLNPKNIFDFLQSDLFLVFAEFLNIPENEMTNIISYTATLEKLGVVNWTLFGFGKRLLCHLTVNNFSEINDEVFQNTMKKMMSDPKCSDEELKTKWKTLVTTFGVYVKPMLLEFIGSAVTEVNQWPQYIMAGLKEVDWTTIKAEIVKNIQEINEIVDMIFANIQKSSNRKWTLPDLVKNFVCGMNIVDFSLIDENFLKNWMSKIGNLDLCDKQQEAKAWDNFLTAMAKLYVGIVADVKNSLDGMDIGDLDLTDDQVRLILYGVKVIGIKKLDVVLGMIWKNLKKYPNETLDLDYILKFLSCHIKENEINSMDLNNLMAILSKFGQPLSCTPQENWLEKLLKLLWKLDFEYTFQQLDQLQAYIGDFTTDDLKRLVKEAQVLKDAAMASFNKVSTRSDKWIEYIKNQENLSLNMSIIAREFICFTSKADFSTVQSAITSFGDIGACTETERTKSTEDFFKILADNNLDELKEILIAIGIFTGQIDVAKMKTAVSKVIEELYKYSLEIERLIPQELKDLTIMKVMTAIAGPIKPLDECLMCVLKAIMWHIFEQPGGPTLMECLFPEYTTNVNPGKKPGGDIADRYRLGFDFPFSEKIGSNKKELLEKLLAFTRKPESEKEDRILKHVTKVVVRYLINNPDELNELVKSNDNKQRVMAMAAFVGETSKLLMKMNAKMDKETLSKVKGVSSRNQVKTILKKAMKDMEISNKTPEEKKEFIKNIPVELFKKAGPKFFNQLYSSETKKAFIAIFKKKPQTQVNKESDTDETVDEEEQEEEQEETESLTKLSLVDKLMKNPLDTETMSLIMDSTLVNAIPIKTFKKISTVCRMDMDTTELKYSQIQYIIKTCPNDVANLAKTKASDLGKLVTKLPKDIINTLTLDQLIKVTAEACKYERKLDIDLEIALKNRFLALKLDPTVNGINMSCVIKYVDQGLDWKPPVGIQICQLLGRSMLKRIPPKNAIAFKNNCLKLLKDKNIAFADMRSMVTYLTLDDVKDLFSASLLQGAAVLERYINDPGVFTEIGKKISELNGFKNPSNLTTDQVTQVRLFIATWNDAENIPKASISEAFETLALGANRLQKKKLRCMAQGEGECNKMDAIMSKIVKVLIASITTTNTRRKRSTTSCSCSSLVGLGTAAVQVSALQISEMICSTNFDECMDGLSQITAWKNDQREVFLKKAISFWGQPSAWNSTQIGVASAIVPILSTDQIKVLSTFSHDNAFEVGKQNNWAPEKLTETFLLFAIKQLSNNVSAISSLDLQTLGNIVCGISVANINKIQKESYVNAASQIGSLTICSQAQFTAWARKALQEYGDDVTQWGLAEISSIGSVINGFSTEDLQKLNPQQISAITETTITKIFPTKMASLHPTQIGYLTTSQAQVVTSAQMEKMTEEQKNILMKKKVGYETTLDSGGRTIDGTNSMKMLTPLLIIVSKSFVNLLSGV